ncbi:methyltransferase [Microbulbifer hydrolyticus]|uniref:tRNA 5-carboxymethoxyuridine methyltransferase n=1 Tax=Microbulbifer hydrolyticus TaxID=48074 RepID=A0A6P1TC91_9GAMM|nr:methyltransferase [Microbulbifer hydrolyticus]MBB5210250.1 S-adenosylmethionine-dependent methyltransferase [Microbulbifer hydrolyticus]QHQ39246.1 methyltransferase domain-containing protein [Microbulbifer hydrolyticus]
MADRNFDDLAQRFRKRIYGGLKGDIRLAVLNRDLAPILAAAGAGARKEGAPLKVVDAGGGQGQFALDLAADGHKVWITDISSEMLALAREQLQARNLEHSVQTLQVPLQSLTSDPRVPAADLLLCHAVLEWLEQPQQALVHLAECLAPGAYLSLTFYNRRALEFRLLQRGSLRQLDRNRDSGYWGGHPGSLTPQNPLLPEEVMGWVEQAGLSLVAHSGIRCFHDFMTPEMRDKLPPAAIVEKELAYSRVDPYRQLARYVHLLCRRA